LASFLVTLETVEKAAGEPDRVEALGRTVFDSERVRGTGFTFFDQLPNKYQRVHRTNGKLDCDCQPNETS
jgi:hypothetical protein